MRIYRRKEFLELPSGVIYAKGQQWYFNGFNAKGESDGNDWTYLAPMWIEARNDGEQWDRLEAMLEDGASYPMQAHYGRDGYFDEDELFLVAERADLEKLRALIDAALAVTAGAAEPS